MGKRKSKGGTNLKVPLKKPAKVMVVSQNGLPSSSTREHESAYCDVCFNKGVDIQPSVTYCTFCTAKYCTQHQEYHDAIHNDHTQIDMEQYVKRVRKLQPRMCAEHKELPYSMGCRSCLTLVCAGCVNKPSLCKDGAAHTLMSIDKFVAELTKEIEEMRAELSNREEKLSDMSQNISRIISEYDTETESSIETLHKTCDEQVAAIYLKYQNLAKELLELRKCGKSDVARFMEEDVGVKLSDARKHRLQIEARLRHTDQVHMVSQYEAIRMETMKLLSGPLPILELLDMVTLEVEGQKREIEVKVVTKKYPNSEVERGQTIAVPLSQSTAVPLSQSTAVPLSQLTAVPLPQSTDDSPPKSMTLLKAVETSWHCYSACHYQGYTYVGLSNGVARINENFQISKSFLNFNDCVECIAVYENQVYTLVNTRPNPTVNVHDLTGRFIRSWKHTDVVDTFAYSKFAIVDNQIIIPDRKTPGLCVYSLTGEVIKYIRWPPCSTNWIAMCAADDHSVVISDYTSSQVIKVNVATGEICWRSCHVHLPEGVTCNGSQVFVTTGSTSTRVWVLDKETGNLLTEISDPTIRYDSYVFDLHISGKTLVIPRHDGQQVLFYLLD